MVTKTKLVLMKLVFILAIGCFMTISSKTAEATTTKINEEISKADQELKDIQQEIKELNEKAVRVEQAIEDNNKKIEQTIKEIELSNKEISVMDNEISEIEVAIERRTEILKNRAISYQHSGGNVSYLDVLMTSTSFSDFVNRAIAVGKIVEADNNLIKEQLADQNKLEETKAEKVHKLANLKELKTELEGMQEHILAQKTRNDQLKEELKSEETAILAAKRSLEAKAIELQYANTKTKNSANEQKQSTKAAPTNLPQNSTTITGTVQDLITAGYKYIGNSVYVFGGGRNSYDIENGRFDCSGFVNWAFSTIGINVGASTDTLKYAGEQISPNNMQPGDLVFFDTYKVDGHVGIYMGGGKYIGAQSSTGVAVANMSSGYWADKFNGRVVRIIN